MNNRIHPKTYYIKTFGCQMNYSDSERIESVLHRIGLKSVPYMQKADVIVFNSCSVRQSAEDRIFGLKHNVLKLKELRNQDLENTDYQLPITVLTGCMIRRTWDKTSSNDENQRHIKNLKQRAPWVDIIIEIKDIQNLLELLQSTSNHPTIRKSNNHYENYLSIAPYHNSTYKALVPISTGCNEFCSYCIVPKARGKQIDRAATLIIEEFESLIQKGYKDIMLLGQNVNSWKNPTTKGPQSFTELLKEIDSIKGNYWLSFLSSHPNYFSDDLVRYFIKSATAGNKRIEKSEDLSRNNHIRPYLNLAVQSGSNKILKQMNRKYKIDKYKKICRKLKNGIRNLNLTTDIIIGFPGETQADFEKTLDLFHDMQFDMAYLNRYSARKGTSADLLTDNVKLETKKRREKEVDKVLKLYAFKNNKRYKDKIVRVLIDRVIPGEYASGKSFNFKDVRIPIRKKSNIKASDFIDVKIMKSSKWSLEGEIIK